MSFLNKQCIFLFWHHLAISNKEKRQNWNAIYWTLIYIIYDIYKCPINSIPILYIYTNFFFVYPASSAGKRFTSTKEVNIFLEQVSRTICKTLDWIMGGMSQWFPFYFLVILDCLTRVVWTVQIRPPPPPPPPKQPVEWKKKKKNNTERSAHNAIKSALVKLVSKQNTAAPEEEKPALWLSNKHGA